MCMLAEQILRELQINTKKKSILSVKPAPKVKILVKAGVLGNLKNQFELFKLFLYFYRINFRQRSFKILKLLTLIHQEKGKNGT